VLQNNPLTSIANEAFAGLSSLTGLYVYVASLDFVFVSNIKWSSILEYLEIVPILG
jgi:hypothetical protein